jgi:hypothetical protein
MNINVRFDPADYDQWVLTEPYVRDTSIGRIEVPVGFETDLASIPHQVWLRYPRWGPWSGAALIHDYLYRERPNGIDRATADRVFLELMREDRVRYGDYSLIHTMVRQFGDSAWNEHRNRPIHT